MVCVMVLLQPFCANTVKVAKYCPWVSKLVVVCGPVPLVPLPKLQFHPMIGAPVVVLVLVNTVCDPAHALLHSEVRLQVGSRRRASAYHRLPHTRRCRWW